MARHDDRQRVGGAGGADGADGPRAAHELGDLLVGAGGAVVDPGQDALDLLAEAGGQGAVQRQVEAAAGAGEVLLQLDGRLVEPARRLQHAGADPRREGGEHGVEILALEGDADQPLRGRGEQERAEGGVERAIGDLDEAGVVGLLHEAGAESCQGRVGEREERLPLARREVLGEARGVGHRAAPSVSSPAVKVRRRARMPSAEARRTASALPPIRAAVSACGSPPR